MPSEGGAACNADFIIKQHDKPVANYEKMKKKDAGLEAQINAIDIAQDHFKKDNRDKRRGLCTENPVRVDDVMESPKLAP